MIPIEIEVYAKNNPSTLLDVLNGRMSPQYLEEIGGNGGGSLVVNLRDPKIVATPSLLDYRNLLRVKVDGTVVGAMLIQKKTTKQVGDSAEDEEIVISGEGLRSWFNDATVYPYGGLKAHSKDTRYFNFATEVGAWYVSGSWVTPKNLSRQGDKNGATNPKAYFPAEWPDAPNAWWMWANSGTINTATPGTCYFRSTFTIGAGQGGPHSLFFTVDDTFEVYLDGERLQEEIDVWAYAWKTTKRLDFDLTEGQHVIAIKASNTTWPFAHNPGGVLAALFKVGDASVPTSAQIVMQSGDSTWKVLEYPSVVPGWSPGEILLALMAEAQTRGVLFPTYLTPTFTATTDSYGAAWDRSLDWSFSVGSDLGAVIEKMEELACDIWIDPATLQLHAAAKRGTDRSTYQLGTGTALTNVVTDPSFESAGTLTTLRTNVVTNPVMAGSAGAWTADNLPALTTSYVATGGPSGVGAGSFAKHTLTATGSSITGGIKYSITPTIGSIYAGSIYVRVSVAQRLRPRWFHVGPNTFTEGPDVDVPANTWTRLSLLSGAVPAATTASEFSVYATTGGNGHIWASGETIDHTNGQIEIWYKVDSFFWGGQTATTDETFNWTGTVNASNSRLQVRSTGGAGVVVAGQRYTYRHSGAAFESSYGQRSMLISTGTAIGVQITNASQTSGETWTIVFMARANNRTQVITPRIRGANGTAVTLPVGVWTEVRATVVVGGSSTASTGYLIAANSGHQIEDTIDVDLATIVAGTYTGPPFSGSTPASSGITGGTHAWTGTVNASSSTRTPNIVVPGGYVPVVFEKGKNLLEATVQGQGDVTNALMVQSEEGWVEATAPAGTNSLSTYGRVESRIDANTSAAVASQLASTVFSQKALPEEGASYEIVPFDGSVPWKDFSVGDWVLAPDATGLLVKRRVVSISLTENDAGNPVFAVEFDTIFRDNEERISRWLARQAGGQLGAGSFANAGSLIPPAITQPTPPSPPSPIIVRNPVAPTSLTVVSTGVWSADGVTPLSEVVVSWAAVSLNIDGSTTVPDFYEVWAWDTAEVNPAPSMYASTSATSTTISGFPVSTTWAFKVRAHNATGEYGEYSSTVNELMESPAYAMSAPTTPVLTSSLGLLNVAWNGLLGGATPPPQFRYVYASISTSSGGTYTKTGPVMQRDARNISITGLTVGTTYWVKLTAVDGLGVESPASAAASLAVVGVIAGDLDSTVNGAISAAQAAATEAKTTQNLLWDSGFELNTSQYWTIMTPAAVTNVTTSPRSGTRHLRLATNGATYEAIRYVDALSCEPNDEFVFWFWVNATDTGTTDWVDNALELQIRYGATNTTTSVISIAPSRVLTTGSYVQVSGSWKAPAGTYFFRPSLMMMDTTTAAGNVYYVDDFRAYYKVGTTTIVDGAIVSDKIAASAVVAGKIAAGAVVAGTIASEAVTAGTIAAGAVTAETIAAGAITADAIQAGAIQTNHLSPAIGGELDISANDSIQLVVGQIDSVQTDVNATNDTVETMQTYYNFGTDGAVISKPGSPFAVAVRSDRIEMLENGNVVSYWNSGQMVVTQFVGEVVVLGNHQLEKYGDGTVVRALGL